MKIISRIKTTLLSGLIIWLPIIVTIYIIRFIVDALDRLITVLPPQYQPYSLIGVNIPGTGIIICFIILILTGALANNIIGKKILLISEKILNRIPVIRSIYNSLKKMSTTLLKNSNNAFLNVLLIEYPRKGLYSIAFQTSDITLNEETKEQVVTVFIPTTPNPTSGYVIILPADETIKLNVSVEDALKMIISLGSITPKGIEKNLSEHITIKDNP